MKPRYSWITVALVFAASVILLHAAELRQATVTRITNQVEIVPPNAKPAPATIGNVIRGSVGVQTGAKSLAELTFTDQTLARLGANTLFSFDSGTRTVELQNGTILIQVPKNAGGAKIKTAPVTAAITGTTVLFEFTPGSRGKKGVIKMIVLEGTMRLSLNNRLGESILLNAGQVITFPEDATSFPEPQTVDLKRILQTSKLVNAGPLGNQEELISEVQEQKILKEEGNLVEVNFEPQRDNGPARLVSQIENVIQNQTTVVNNAPPPPPPTPLPTPIPIPTPIATPDTNY